MADPSDQNPVKPKNAIVILLDSLNRHMLGAYGGTEFATPNLDAFARRSMKFNNHFVGSLPCMPARHDILCGALDFLWKPWGSIELWEDPITWPLREKGVVTQLITDHPHLFEVGGENYYTDFNAWDYLRGHEHDSWKTRADPSFMGAPHHKPARLSAQELPYDRSRTYFKDEADFPGPRTMASTAQWIEDNAGHHDRFFLFVDEFDPHEPFDAPEPWASMYDPDWSDPRIVWPPYAVGAVRDGLLTEREGQQLRANYGGKLSMIDHWFDKVMEKIDAKGLWEDTMVVLCTDHGHYLGEHDTWGKPGTPIRRTLGHIPLMIAWPGLAAGENNALTTSVDLHATLRDIFDAEVPHVTHGHSLVPLLEDKVDKVRDYALGGIWGREVHLFDGTYNYSRAAPEMNYPISVFSNRWSSLTNNMFRKHVAMPPPNERAFLDRMPGSDIPVIRQPYAEGDPGPYWLTPKSGGSSLWNMSEDPSESDNLVGSAEEARLAECLGDALRDINAPEDQFERLGLK